MAKAKSLTQTLGETNREIEALGKEMDRLHELKKRMKELKGIKKAIDGLEETKQKSRRKNFIPGKYSPAYYYVKSMDEEHIVPRKDLKPGLTYACPECGIDVPVLMSYNQECDSPEHDEWVTKAFIICCSKMHELKRLSS